MTNKLNLYDSAYLALFDGTMDWDGMANVAAVLCESAYTPDAAAHTSYSHLTNISATADKVAVTGRATNLVSGQIRYTADKISFGAEVSISGQYIALVAGDPANLQASDPLIGWIDLGETKTSENAEFSATPAAEGLFRISKAA